MKMIVYGFHNFIWKDTFSTQKRHNLRIKTIEPF